MQVLSLDALFTRYEMSIRVGDVDLTFDVRWNQRAGSWYLGVYAEDGTPIRVGVRVVLGAFLGGRSVDPRMPPGRLMAVDLTGSGREATIDDLGTRVQIQYWPNEELGA